MIPVSALALGIWGLFLFALERHFPTTEHPNAAGRFARNLALGLLVLAIGPVVQAATIAVSGGVQPLFILENLAAQLLILDLWTYAVHRAYHRIPFMWRMHAVHHLDETLDVTSAVRFHVLEIIWSSLLRLIPLFVLGVSLETNALFGAILTASALFHHSNIRLPAAVERTLSWIIVTPSIHWVHHHAVQVDTDSNYASILSIWDRLFGSRSQTARWINMPIGVEDMREQTLPRLLAWPFKRQAKQVDVTQRPF